MLGRPPAGGPLDPTLPPGALDLAAASQSPCTGCAAWCCTVLPVHSFTIDRWSDLDYARYLLNFARIELALIETGAWQVHYRAPCRHFMAAERRCAVHRQPEQPSVCRAYDAYNCAYRAIWGERGRPALRMDRGRLDAWAAMVLFDEQREIIGVPDFAHLPAALPPLAPVSDPPVPPSAVLAQALGGPPAPAPAPRPFAALAEPCAGCAAWCCTRLSFPRAAPTSAANLDHLRFCLGFDGVEAGVDRAGNWTLTLRTACAHRVVTPEGAGRCGLYDDPARPRVCERYDGRACAYKARYGRPDPGDFARLDRGRLARLSATLQVDADFRVVNLPDFDALVGILTAPEQP
jgi:hypothetical protein